MAPEPQETLLELCVVFGGEVAEEAAYHLALLVGEVGDVVELVDVAQIGKYAVGICHILVNVIEVGQQKLSPAIELVERFAGTRLQTERLVEVAHLLDGVGNL